MDGLRDKTKVLIALSGGVDSSVCAKLLIDDGFDVAGATMQLIDEFDTSDAKSVCENLDIPFSVFECRKMFTDEVKEYFVCEYERGNTPNPCIVCNKKMKFGYFQKKALEMGFDKMATGHYARIEYSEKTGRYLLRRAKSLDKDQSYFLYGLTQDQLSKTLFPLGEYTKEEVRNIAESKGLVTARKSDSQDICFIDNNDYFSFIQKYRLTKHMFGTIMDKTGNILGSHKGAISYTLGQRKGLGISLGKPAYVIDKDMASNTLILGEEADLYKTEVIVENLNWIFFPEITKEIEASVKLRYGKREDKAVIIPEGSSVRLLFSKPQRAPAPGQAAVFYDGEYVLGGGTITAAF